MTTNSDRQILERRAARTARLDQRCAGYSLPGTRREVNQDRFVAHSGQPIFMVADGMGGMRAGEQAAQMAIDLLPNHPALIRCDGRDREAIRERISRAFLDVNEEIVGAADLNPQFFGMGTTAVFAMLVEECLFIASLGDSRAYLLRDGCLHQYTIDHSMAQTLVSLGVLSRNAARTHRWRHMLCKFLGNPDFGDGPDISVIRLLPEDRVVLVTDGVTESLTDRHITTVLRSNSTAAAAAKALVLAAVSRGARDDCTSVVLDVNAANGAQVF